MTGVAPRRQGWVTPAKNSFVSGGNWSNRYLYVLTVVTDNNRVQQFHAYIDHTRARAVARSAMAIGPPRQPYPGEGRLPDSEPVLIQCGFIQLLFLVVFKIQIKHVVGWKEQRYRHAF